MLESLEGFSQKGKIKTEKVALLVNCFPKANLLGSTQSSADPCLFISDHVICLVYVYVTLFKSPNKTETDKTLDRLKELEMDLNVEDEVAGFLGVLIKRLDNNKIELTQTGLIKRFIEAMGIEGENPKATPSEAESLPSDQKVDPTEASFKYASIVGMLQYLQCHNRPAITFLVSQCRRYLHKHTNMHTTALKRIARYLLQSEKALF